jgi:two-component system OmpR family sensor kinase
MKWYWWLAPAPLLFGLAVGVFWQLSGKEIPVVRMRIDVATVLLFFCAILSLALTLGFFASHRMRRVRLGTAAQAAEDRRRFLQRLDHELKNPLTAILAGLANLSGAISTSSQKNTFNSVEAQVKRLRDLVADLRKLSDLETRPIENVPIDMTALLEGLVALTKEEIGESDRRLNLIVPHAPWPLPNVFGDWDLLFLAVHNLLQNALKFTSPDDTIEIRAVEDGSSVVIEVADTGPGIPEEDVPHVWEELYRSDSARGVPGSGLGLALVRAIVLRHGGEVGLRSRKGQGTVFNIRLPVKESPKR